MRLPALPGPRLGAHGESHGSDIPTQKNISDMAISSSVRAMRPPCSSGPEVGEQYFGEGPDGVQTPSASDVRRYGGTEAR